MHRTYYADDITQSVTMPDVIRKYTSYQPKKNRIPCPLHNGKDYNFSFNDKVFFCFVCGEKGNIFSFVMKMFGLNYPQALQKIQYDFGLEVQTGVQSLRQKRQAKYQLINKVKTEKAKETASQKKVEEVEHLQRIWDCYKLCLDVYKPTSPNEELHPHYIEALHNINYYEYLLRMAESGGKAIE